MIGGIMIFGHETTSQDIRILDNTFAYDGCEQVRAEGVSRGCKQRV